MIELLKENWMPILFAVLAFAEVIVRLTPSKKDDSILEWIYKILGLIFPNRKEGGGTH